MEDLRKKIAAELTTLRALHDHHWMMSRDHRDHAKATLHEQKYHQTAGQIAAYEKVIFLIDTKLTEIKPVHFKEI